MELAIYLFIVGAAILLAMTNPRMHTSAFLFFAYPLAIIHALAVRLIGFEDDVLAYAARMKIGATFDLYYAREPIVWYGQTLLYRLTGSEVVSFLIFDCLGIAAVFAAFHLLRVPRYAYAAFLTFFPFILGFQNAYRQWMGMCLMLLAIALLPRFRIASLGAALAAALSHNTSAIFFGMMAPLWPASRYRRVAIYAAFAILPPAIYFGGGSKSVWQSGVSLEYIYPIILGVGALTIAAFEAARGIGPDKLRVYVALIFAVEVSIFSAIFLASAGAERMSMFALFMMYPFVALAIENGPIRPRWPLRIILIVGSFVPILLFETRKFLL